MKRRLIAAGSVVAAVVAVAAAVLAVRPPGERYAELRIVRAERVPGTVATVVEAAPESYVPAISPQQAFRRAFPVDPPSGMFHALGTVRDSTLEAPGASPPSWIFVGRAICYASGKCSLVSAARSGFEGCTNKHLSLVAVSADGSGTIRSYEAYDDTEVWKPVLGGTA